MLRFAFSTWMLLAALPATLACTTARAAAGDADPSFGGTGYIRYAAPRTLPGLLSAGLGKDDGSVIVAGGADTDVFVRRYRPDGLLDEGFGTNGTTRIPGFTTGDGRNAPPLSLYRDPRGGTLIEQSGNVRRLTSAGFFDGTYSPATMNGAGRALMPQQDGRFVVVTAQQAPEVDVADLKLRFYLPDGKPDTTRGDANGERLLHPSVITGAYTNIGVHAVTDAEGKILIAARWTKSGDNALVLLRLNPDGSYDDRFGQGGVVLIGTMLGYGVSSPEVSVGSDGRIGYLFSVNPVFTNGDPYFVVHVLLRNGHQDASAPSGGRILVIPKEGGVGVGVGELQWLAGAPGLAIAGVAGGRRLLLWRADLVAGTIGTPEYSSALETGFSLNDVALAGNGRLWAFGTGDQYIYDRQGFVWFAGMGRGVLLSFDIRAFSTATPLRIVPTLSGRYQEAFSEAKLLSTGSILVLGSYTREREAYPAPTLTRFTADGVLDAGYGTGAARIDFSIGDRGISKLVPSPDDRATVLRTLRPCFSCAFEASLWRFTAVGAADATFGAAGKVSLRDNDPIGITVAAGFVDAAGAVTLVRLGTQTIRPIRYTAAGTADPTLTATAQAVPVPSSQDSRMTLDALPDGRLQGVAVFPGAQQMTLGVYRWMQGGAVDPSFSGSAAIALPEPGVPVALDTLVLADGRTLVAIDGRSALFVLRLLADGALDATFGTGGFVRIERGAPTFSQVVFSVKLALESDGKILLTFNDLLGTSAKALTVARLTLDGRPDPTFTSDGRFDSVFSLLGNDTSFDVLALPDGRLLAVGQSDGFGLLLKLRGTSLPSTQPSAAVVEFFNNWLGHYFITGGAGEIMAIDAGGAGPGWQRTGYGFRAYGPAGGVPGGAAPVCRFYGTPGRGPNSHFYTVNASECAAVKADPGWTFEGTAFHLFAPINGQCSGGQQPVYRTYNGRFEQNDSNHRYTTNAAVYAQMQVQGWAPEGVVFCGPVE